ncbi:MAG: peptidase domain-containing ABC transporter [Alphaproteobacteria bacterium]|nr:peptidase domain-containing ABC transporter [Alphaproteobacteria bacterium]
MIRPFPLFGAPRSKIRLVRQAETVECGLACLVMVANFHGRGIDLPAVRKAVPSLARGASLRTLSTLADHFGFVGRGVQLQPRDFDRLRHPLILHWNNDHFVVLETLANGHALIHDPKGLTRWMTLGELERHFTGFAFEMSPSGEFGTDGSAPRRDVSYLWSHARGMRSEIVQALVLTLFLQIAVLAPPYFAQMALDRALPQKNHGFLAAMSIACCAFVLLNGAVSFLRLSIIRHIGATFTAGLASQIAHKLFRLPMDWFRKREAGGILSRFQSIFPIKHSLSEALPAAAINVVLAALTFVMMLIYSPVLSIIGIVALALYAFVRAALLPRQKQALSEMIEAVGKEQAFLISSLHCMRSLRLSCREVERHRLWSGKFASFVAAETRHKKWADCQAAFQATLLALAYITALWIAVAFAMRGGFTPGMIFAFMSYMLQFLTSGTEFIDKLSSFKELDAHLDGLADIMDAQEDAAFEAPTSASLSLNGAIELRGVSFRYGFDGEDVLKDINLSIQPGESVAITGPSGGGKSTLAQILLGLNQPNTGSMLVDGRPLADFGLRNYFRQVAAVLQDEGLFAGTVLDNITLFAECVDMQLVEECTRAAAINDEIHSWPLKYATLVGDRGIAVSSGQRQRVLLARALYCRPRILVLDEGTAHLDSRCEKRVNDAIRRLGITRIIFAHRRETVASADRIMILRDGRLTDATVSNLEALHA